MLLGDLPREDDDGDVGTLSGRGDSLPVKITDLPILNILLEPLLFLLLIAKELLQLMQEQHIYHTQIFSLLSILRV